MKIVYMKSCFAVIENTLTDNSKTYDVALDAEGMNSPTPELIYGAVSLADEIDRCDRLAAAVEPADGHVAPSKVRA